MIITIRLLSFTISFMLLFSLPFPQLSTVMAFSPLSFQYCPKMKFRLLILSSYQPPSPSRPNLEIILLRSSALSGGEEEDQTLYEFRDATTKNKSTMEKVNMITEVTEDDVVMTMPWGDNQSWALRDNLERYTVSIPNGGDNGNDETCALWRSMTRDVVELAGYDVRFLRRKHREEAGKAGSSSSSTSTSSSQSSSSSPSTEKTTITPKSLPLLDSFEFVPNGGVRGLACGVPGIADGSVIVTPPLSNVAYTVPRGYVISAIGGSVCAYELGLPLGSTTSDQKEVPLSFVGAVGGIQDAIVRDFAGAGGSSDVAKVVSDVLSDVDGAIGSKNGVVLAGKVGIAALVSLGAFEAISLLGHHLTVNMFWV